MALLWRQKKPGRGISKEEAEDRNYFKILGRKFSLIIKANLLFIGVNILPVLALLVPFFLLLTDTSGQAAEYYANILSGKQLMSPVPFLILALFAPTFAGLTYLCRNFARQEHVFLVSDFFEHTKKNWKQALIAGFILSALLYVYLTAFLVYWNSESSFLRIAISIFGMFFIYMSFYIFPQIVTFRLSLAKIFQNALHFAILNLPYNILLFVVLIAIHGFLILRVPILWLILMAFFLIAFTTYTINYVTWTVIEKYMIEDNKGL